MAKKFPKKELKLIDLTLRMFTEPTLELDLGLLEMHLEERQGPQRSADDRRRRHRQERPDVEPEVCRDAEVAGCHPAMKISPTTGKETFAFAKNDEEFKALLEHEDDRVQALVAARLGTKIHT
jgi:hypothetical protein